MILRGLVRTEYPDNGDAANDESYDGITTQAGDNHGKET